VREFVYLRCPVFKRRDRALGLGLLGGRIGDGIQPVGDGDGDGGERNGSSTTFDEVWNAVVGCSTSINREQEQSNQNKPSPPSLIGIEGWMVFSRFIALAQYQEAKRRFSSRHLQHTGVGDEVLINVPPVERPLPITVRELVEYEMLVERNGGSGVALPELDLDHQGISARDGSGSGGVEGGGSRVKIEIFGTANTTALPLSSEEMGRLEFAVSYFPPSNDNDEPPSPTSGTPERNYNNPNTIVVKRSFTDLLWLHNILLSQKQLGGTLCGRILPPFPSAVADKYSDYHEVGDGGATTTPVIAGAAAASVGMIASVGRSAKSFLGGYLSTSPSTTYMHHGLPSSTTSNILAGTTTSASITGGHTTSKNCSLQKRDGSFLDSSLSKANQIERYLNFLLEHPALSSSFPLNVILKASQSGLECAKRILDNNAKHRDHSNVDIRLVMLDAGSKTDHNNCLPSSSSSSLDFHHRHHHPSSSSSSPHTNGQIQNNVNLSWIRTAAQAALALKLHGVLETTGCQSASAKLLHASLPTIHSSGGYSSWNDIDNDDIGAIHYSSSLNNNNNNNNAGI